MKITQEQQSIIDSLICERLSDNPENLRIYGSCNRETSL